MRERLSKSIEALLNELLHIKQRITTQLGWLLPFENHSFFLKNYNDWKTILTQGSSSCKDKKEIKDQRTYNKYQRTEPRPGNDTWKSLIKHITNTTLLSPSCYAFQLASTQSCFLYFSILIRLISQLNFFLFVISVTKEYPRVEPFAYHYNKTNKKQSV